MAYIGNDPSNRFVAPKAASVFSGDGSTTAFTLDHAVGSDEDILVSVDGVIQEPSVAYAVSSGTTLTFTAAPSSNSGNNIFVYYLFRTVGTVSHPSNNALSASTGTFSGTLDVTGTPTFSSKIATTNFGTGAILQVKQTVKSDTFSTNSTSYTDVTGLSVAITPSSTSNKILFMANLSVGGANAQDANHVYVQMLRGSTAINIGDARGSRERGTNVINNGIAGQMFHPSSCFLDSPSTTSETTYKIQMKSSTTSEVGCINRSGRDSDNAQHDGNASSTITVMEVAG